jgi:protein ImuB
LNARRIAAVFMPDLACEIVSSNTPASPSPPSLPADRAKSPESKGQTTAGARLPLAVVDARAETASDEEAALGDVILAADEVARRYGVRAGQTVAEARALVAHLVIRGLAPKELRQALGRVAEVVLGFGGTASIDAGDAEVPADTVWVDLTGSAQLFGGEEAMALEIGARVRELGHKVKVGIAGGPRLARAAAVFAQTRETIVSSAQGEDLMRSLPLEALPLSRERILWLHRLGLWTVGELANLPFATLAVRLGENWKETLALARGEDAAPLVAYQPPRAPREEMEWDEPVSLVEPLLFGLRRLVALLSARLEGRGEAAQAIELFAPYDRSIARARGVQEKGLEFRVDLPTALSHAPDLFRVLKTKLERVTLAAPVKGLAISASLLTRATRVQLSLDDSQTTRADPRSMAVFLAEVSAEIGPENVGVLELQPVHRPEARTKLAPFDAARGKKKKNAAARGRAHSDDEFPTRLLPEPVLLPVFTGEKLMVSIDNQLYSVEAKSHPVRFEAVEWWTASPMNRDYARVLLTSGNKSVWAWIFTDRNTGRAFLHGYFD